MINRRGSQGFLMVKLSAGSFILMLSRHVQHRRVLLGSTFAYIQCPSCWSAKTRSPASAMIHSLRDKAATFFHFDCLHWQCLYMPGGIVLSKETQWVRWCLCDTHWIWNDFARDCVVVQVRNWSSSFCVSFNKVQSWGLQLSYQSETISVS